MTGTETGGGQGSDTLQILPAKINRKMSHVNVNKQNILITENLVLVDRQQDHIYENAVLLD